MTPPPSSQPWVQRIGLNDGGELFGVSSWPIEVTRDDSGIWLRGESMSGELDVALMGLPGQRLEVLDDGRLRIPGSIIPIAVLPRGPWYPIESVLRRSLPTAALPGAVRQGLNRIPVKLVQTSIVRPVVALVTGMSALGSWSASNALVRHQGLRWLVLSGTNALVVGTPLPSLPGQRLWRSGRCWLPAGKMYSPAISPEDLQQAFNIHPDQMILWRANDQPLVVNDADFRPLSRASVRLAIRELVA